MIYDETGGMSLLPDSGMLEELFADPSVLAVGSRYGEALPGYLDSGSICPNSLRRLAAAHPDTADEVYRTVAAQARIHLGRARRTPAPQTQAVALQAPPYPKVTPTSQYLAGLLSS